jgi:hypothetical protein
MPPARGKTRTFKSRQRAIRCKYTVGAETAHFEAFLEQKNAAHPPQPNQAPATVASTTAVSQSQFPGPATVQDPPAPSSDTEMHDYEMIAHSGTQVSLFLRLIA